ncbi:unnamed protein product [Closterium sp. Yama58-4]|nr:unnamed protein product [Closterium sp. Yama58-4]
MPRPVQPRQHHQRYSQSSHVIHSRILTATRRYSELTKLRVECSSEFPRHETKIAISVTVFSFMAWVSYLFLTKDE